MNVTSLFRRRHGHGPAAGHAAANMRPPVFPGMDPALESPWVRAELARIDAEVRAQQAAEAALLAETEQWGPLDRPDGLLMNEADLTDGRVAPAYIPGPPAAILDIFADIRDLPVLRDAIRATTQRGCTECGTCGRAVPGWDWQERFAAQLAHVASGQDARSNGTGRAAEPAQDEAVTAETEQAA